MVHDPQSGADPRDEFGEPERLGDVVVGAGVEPDDHVHLLGACGQHDDRQVGMAGPNLATHVEPVDVRQCQVEQDQVGSSSGDAVDRTHATVDVLDHEALGSQDTDERFADALVVLDQQHGRARADDPGVVRCAKRRFHRLVIGTRWGRLDPIVGRDVAEWGRSSWYACIVRSSTSPPTGSGHRRRRRRASPWAGKPSWSERANTDGVIRVSAPASARAMAVRLRNVSAVIPDDTWAKPDVGSDAGQPITKFAALNGVCWPTRISPALTSPSTTSSVTAVGDGDLEVFGSELVGDPDRDVERIDQDAAAVRAERRSRSGGANVGEPGELSFEFGVDGVGERIRVGEQHDGAVGAVLGLDQQVGGQQCRVGRVVGDHEALGRAEQHHRGDPVALHLDLRNGHGRRARPDDLAHLRDRVGAEAERSDARRAVDAEHVGDAELAAHHEHRRIDLARPPGTGGTTSAIDGTPATTAGTASW